MITPFCPSSKPLRAVLLFVSAGLGLGPSVSQAGFNAPGITPVPLFESPMNASGSLLELGIDKDALEIFDLRVSHWQAGGETGDRPVYPQFEFVSDGMVNQLGQFPPFQGKTPAQIREKVLQARRAMLCAIDLVSRDNREIGAGLYRILNARRLCIGLQRGQNSARAAIFADGKAEFGMEPVNIYADICEDLPVTDFKLFEFYNTLSHEGLHAVQDILKPTGGLTLEQALDLHCREAEAHEGEVELICKMQEVIASIQFSGQLPADASGGTVFIGANILRLPAAERNQKLSEWRDALAGMKAAREEALRFRQLYKTAGQAVVDGDADAAALQQQLRAHQWFQTFSGQREFAVVNRAIFTPAAPTIEGEPGSRSVEGGGGMRQIIGLSATEISVPMVDIVCDAQLHPGGNVLYIAGVRMEPTPVGVLGCFDLDPSNGAIIPGSFQRCYESQDLGNGFRIFVNTFAPGNPLYGMKLGPADLCRFDDSNGDGCPDMATHVGTLPQSPFCRVVDFQFVGADTIVGYPAPLGDCFDFYQFVSSCERDPVDGIFRGGAPQSWKDLLQIPPSPARPIFDGATEAAFTGTPNRAFDIISLGQGGPDAVIGQGRFGWSGFDCPTLTAPVTRASRIVARDATGSESAVVFPKSPPGPAPRIEEPICLNNGRFKVNADWQVQNTSPPGAEVQVEIFDRNGGSWTPGAAKSPNCWGETFWSFNASEIDLDVTDPTGFFRFRTLPPAAPPGGGQQEFTVTPGVTTCLDLSDGQPDCFGYELVQPPPLHNDLFSFNKDGTFTVTLTTFAGNVSFTYRRVSAAQGAPPGEETTVLIGTDNSVLGDPPPYGDMVNVITLVYGGMHYPLYQFVLANSPTDECKEPHWHSFSEVYPIEAPGVGVSDPAPGFCGFGRLAEVELKEVPMTLDNWDSFKNFAR